MNIYIYILLVTNLYVVPPLEIIINGPTEPISSGRRYVIMCQVTGSRPPPSITWKKGSTRIQGEPEMVR